ncbi:uncharacterized protein BDZ99DRAFT_387974 [Mytilinidion resinicola]|uniref:Uncharacterized protein n=1 Tax=Mytilinidion resinicola TaxID=574789 RepID=A0A6A6YL61_9PEZI|nr:uncharacterized protein BDZ99DRAFT_387974 [Mytilinidion resinicola]KAF2809616.1 hypothetical protein BDZ99DRAFT_387974 [Mytilinidion resinicola]
MTLLTPSAITLFAFHNALTRYPATVPSKLHDLDTARFTTLPATVAKRREESGGDAWLEKREVLQLVEWKLKHGTFRPTLLKLVDGNPAEKIVESTRKAFAALSPTPTPASIAAALPLLTPLSGIGPATASLLLSVAAPDSAPFFSDEVFRWVMWEEAEVKGKGMGWERKIGYTVKEYRAVVEGVGRVMERLGVGAGEVERVAWVLGREGGDLGVGKGGGVGAEVEGKDEGEGEREKLKNGKGVKGDRKGKIEKKTVKGGRKAVNEAVKGEEPRRSKRKPVAQDPLEESKVTKRYAITKSIGFDLQAHASQEGEVVNYKTQLSPDIPLNISAQNLR